MEKTSKLFGNGRASLNQWSKTSLKMLKSSFLLCKKKRFLFGLIVQLQVYKRKVRKFLLQKYIFAFHPSWWDMIGANKMKTSDCPSRHSK